MKLCGRRYDAGGLVRHCKRRAGHEGPCLRHGWKRGAAAALKYAGHARTWRAWKLWLLFDEAACVPLGPVTLGITLDETAVGYYEPRFGVVNVRLLSA